MTNEELVLSYQQGNKQALESLIENNKCRVFKIANKFYTGKTNSIDVEDLEQEGLMGLITAADKYKFDIDNQASFITYATYWIYSKINSFIRKRNTNDETSLNTPLKEDEEIEKQDLIESVEEGFENTEEKLYLKQLREDLEEVMEECTTLKEREVLKLHYGWDCKECSFAYIGSILGVSKSRTQQIESQALRNIRKCKWVKDKYEEYFKYSKYNYKNVTEKIDFASKYFKDVI